MTGLALDAYNARRLWNYLRLMELRHARLRDVVVEADAAALAGRLL